MRAISCALILWMCAAAVSAGDAKKEARIKEITAEITRLKEKLETLEKELASLSGAAFKLPDKITPVREISFDTIKTGQHGPFTRLHQFFEVREVLGKTKAIVSPKNSRAFLRVMMEGVDTSDWADGKVVELTDDFLVLGTIREGGSTLWHVTLHKAK